MFYELEQGKARRARFAARNQPFVVVSPRLRHKRRVRGNFFAPYVFGIALFKFVAYCRKLTQVVAVHFAADCRAERRRRGIKPATRTVGCGIRPQKPRIKIVDNDNPAPVSAPASASGVVPIAVARPRLVVSGTSVEFPLDREVILLGRNSPADGIFPEVDLTEVDTGSYISRRHGRITRQATAFLYEDMGSSNGSFINGNKLVPKTQIELHDGDTLRLGRTEMCFRI